MEALTARGKIKVSYWSPFLLFLADGETARDVLGDFPARKSGVVLTEGVFMDRSWERLVPEIQKIITLPISPQAESKDGWHFYRAYFKAWGLSERELIEVVALSTKTKAKVRDGKELVFELLTP